MEEFLVAEVGIESMQVAVIAREKYLALALFLKL